MAELAKITRCKDCKYHYWEQEPEHGKTIHLCSVLNAEVFKDFYCYHGTPKDDSLADFVRVTRCKDCERSEMYCFGPDEKAVLACVEKDEEDGQIYFAKAVDPMGYCHLGKPKLTIKTGRWEQGDMYDIGDVCSECQYDSRIESCTLSQCPSCGAQMK